MAEKRQRNERSFDDFMKFMGSVWGLAAALSLAFPFASQQLYLIRVPEPMTGIAVALASLVSALCLLTAYASARVDRDTFGQWVKCGSGCALIAWVWLMCKGFEMMHGGRIPITSSTGPTLPDSMMVILVPYVTGFGLLTSAFATVAATIYARDRR